MTVVARWMCLAVMVGCGDDVSRPATESAATATAAISASAVPTESANATPLQRASATSAPTGWLGPIPSEGRATLGKISRYERRDRFEAALAIPEGWSTVRLDEGRGDRRGGDGAGILARPADKSALVIVIEHEAIDDLLVQFGVSRWMGTSGGVTGEVWGDGEIAPDVGEGFFYIRGEGKLWGAPAELVQLRRRMPSAELGPSTLLLLGAVARSAPAQVRASYLACLASYVATKR